MFRKLRRNNVFTHSVGGLFLLLEVDETFREELMRLTGIHFQNKSNPQKRKTYTTIDFGARGNLGPLSGLLFARMVSL
jgi:hypothetical protein